MLGSALGAWWWTTQRESRLTARRAARDRGTVIFENHATASENTDGLV